MNLTDRSVRELIGALRSPDPTPGGGSASALAGAAGAALLAMVAGLPKPRAAGDSEIERLRTAGMRCSELANRLTSLVDRDSEAYDLVVAAYRLPKDSDAEKSARTAAIQSALRAAIEAPADVMRACAAAIEEAAAVAALGNRNASSDMLVGLELLGAGLRGAGHNVEINLGSVKDGTYVDTVRSEIDQLARAASSGDAAARARLASGT